MSDAFLRLDRRWTVRAVNANSERLLATPRAGLIGKNLWQALPDAVDTRLYHGLRDALEEDADTDFEARFPPAGRRFRVRAFPDEQGISIYLQECPQPDDEPRRYRVILRHARDAILFVNTDGRIVEASESAADLYGYSRDELLGLTILDLRAPETRDAAAEQMALADEEGILFETLHRRKDGSIFPVEVSSRGADFGGDRVLLSIIRDITLRRESEQALRESEDRVRAISGATFEGIVIHEGGRILEVNDAALAMFGYERAEAVGADIQAFIHPVYHEAIREHISASSEEPYEVTAVRKDGACFRAEVRGRTTSYQGRPVRAGAIRDISDRVQTEAALRGALAEAEEGRLLLDTIMESVPDGITVADGPDVRVRMSSRYEQQVLGGLTEGVTSVEMTRRWSFYRPDGITPIPEEGLPLVRAVRNGEVVRNEEVIQEDGYGRRITMLCNASPVRDHSGRITGGILACRDITIRKEAEQALESERARLQTVLATLPVGVFIAEASGRMVAVNDAGRQIWGQDAPLAGGVSEYVEYKGWHPDTGERYTAEDWALARALIGGETIVGEVIDIERFDGIRATILNSAAPILDDEGRIAGAVVTVQDITDIRVAQEEVRRSRDLLESIIDNTPAAVYVKNPDGTIVLANQALADLLGRRKQDFRGKTSFDFYPEEVAEEHTRNDREIMRRGEPLTFEEIVPEDGSVRTFLSVKFPLKDAEGIVYGVGGVSSEITDRVRAEQALQRERGFLAALESIGEAGISTMHSQELLDLLAARIQAGTGSHSCTILLLDDTADDLVARAAVNIPEETGFRVHAYKGFAGKIRRVLRTLYVRDASTDPLVTSPHVKRAGARSLLGTPLVAHGRFIGVIYIDETSVREFPPDEVRLFELMASRASVAIDNLRLFEEVEQSRQDLEKALERESYFSLQLQTALLPPEPQVGPGYSVGHVFVSPFAGRQIGGDFYDVFRTENECVAITIGDVSGKGLEATSIAAATRSTLRAFAYDLSSPGPAVTHTNAVMCASQPGGGLDHFVTVLLAVLDPGTGRIDYASAGHPPALIYRGRSGEIERLTFGNPPIGVVPSYSFAEGASHLDPGDKIVFYTDGLSEARRDGDMFELEGIEEVLRECGSLDAGALVNELLSRASDWAQGRLRDDTAILVVERQADHHLCSQAPAR